MSEYQDCNATECIDVKIPAKRGKTLLEQMKEDGAPLPPTEADKELLQKMTGESTESLEGEE